MTNELFEQRSAALRLILGSLGALLGMLVILAIVRPDMTMAALHHMEAMVGMHPGHT
jgi:hypothetical protein